MQYLNDYASANHLNIQYNTNITRVEKEGSLFHLTDQHGTTYTCDMLIVRLVGKEILRVVVVVLSYTRPHNRSYCNV